MYVKPQTGQGGQSVKRTYALQSDTQSMVADGR